MRTPRTRKWLLARGYSLSAIAPATQDAHADPLLIDANHKAWKEEVARLSKLRAQEKAARPGLGSVIVNGAVGFTKVALNLDSASDALKRQRLDRCKACPHLGQLAAQPQCRLCLCFVELKASIAAEKCPAGLWPGEMPPASTSTSQCGTCGK